MNPVTSIYLLNKAYESLGRPNYITVQVSVRDQQANTDKS